MRAFTRRFLVPLTATALITTGLPAVASADPDPTTGVELNVAQNQFVGKSVTYDPSAGAREGLAALKELRGYMWDQNPPFRAYNNEYSGTLQDAARSQGLRTKEAYQNAVSLDEDLTWIATQRAVEASVKFEHKRPDGTDVNTAKRGTVQWSGESLAVGTPNLRDTIINEWGKGELQALRDANGAWNEHNGHLIHMLNPKNRAYGFGAVYDVPGVVFGHYGRYNYFAAWSSTVVKTPASTQTGKTTGVIYRAALPGERPTGIVSGGHIPAPGGDNPASGSSLDTGQAIGIALGVIALIVTLLGGVSFTLHL
ncbi:hypothetical protein [Corynebacterium liangguodongii]|uniref:Uncharacterized protein n=1 Tax=Corynebacterium liangguodongii TaxID=2079535 RepID=A0A2S0WBE6_9CORY|nr:hypothetical protein [Corynebacterium liangguodongii]AWB83091.1 hypothetical protein C3E79_00125 [Corynebacterium liangguodongii]PWB99308.1 hypothetical protein DF219_06950 [Corynebacterium liangguodongii]